MEINLSRRQLVIGLAAGTVSACVTNPDTGDRQFIIVSDHQLAQLSTATWNDAVSKGPISHDRSKNARLQRIGKRISVAANRGDEKWEYAVFDTAEKNAFVMPGGKVGFYRGMMDFVDNDHQLAAVMGHETGHVTARHAAARYSQQMASGLALTAVNVALAQKDVKYQGEIAAVLGAGVTFGIILPYSRAHESQADKLGVDYMVRAGYKPMEAVRLWEKMAANGGARTPELLSTHPAPETRIRDLNEYIRAKGYA